MLEATVAMKPLTMHVDNVDDDLSDEGFSFTDGFTNQEEEGLARPVTLSPVDRHDSFSNNDTADEESSK